MQLSEILEAARSILDDPINDAYPDDNLWKDSELIRWANWAEEEACERAKLLFDTSTANLSVHTLASGAFEVAMDARIIFIERAWFDGVPLGATDTDQLEHCYGRFWEIRTGAPQAYYTENNIISLFPKPLDGGELKTRCCRLPLTPMNSINDTPEIPARYHEGLVHGICHKAFLKHDTETLDKTASADQEALFTGYFGKATSVHTRNHQRNRVPKRGKFVVM